MHSQSLKKIIPVTVKRGGIYTPLPPLHYPGNAPTYPEYSLDILVYRSFPGVGVYNLSTTKRSHFSRDTESITGPSATSAAEILASSKVLRVSASSSRSCSGGGGDLCVVGMSTWNLRFLLEKLVLQENKRIKASAAPKPSRRFSP
jgi:hypothetical protein